MINYFKTMTASTYFRSISLLLWICISLTYSEIVHTVTLKQTVEHDPLNPDNPIIKLSEPKHHSYWKDENLNPNRRRLAAISDPMDDTDKLNMLEYLNSLRSATARGVSPTKNPTSPAPTASDMNFVFWDQTSEKVSNATAATCTYAVPNTSLYSTYAPSPEWVYTPAPTAALVYLTSSNTATSDTLESALNSWYEEEETFDYDSFTYTPTPTPEDSFTWLARGPLRYIGFV